ncbi:putative porin [Teredinibacter haidensis]|uniref:putative porin n=1 Tax=Teredinibacter haidensis TaxID=2731755 RepID=UPI000AD1C5CA|nr:putative porin [Teredinibacter haidensis]
MKKRLCLSLLAMTISSASLAGSYQAELTGTLGRMEVDGADNALLFGVGGEFHFAPVDTSGKPLAEAAFLNKSSNVNAGLAFANSDDYDVTTTYLGADVYLPNTMVFIGVDYTRMDTDDWDDSYFSVTGGVTPIDGLLLTTTYVEDSGYDLNLQAKYVTQLSGGQAVSVFGSFEDNDSNIFSVGCDFYLNRATSVGLEVTDTGSDKAYTFSANHFLSEVTFVGAYYINQEVADTLGVEGGMRF